MKQKIPLTEFNKKILVSIYGMKPDELDITHWIKVVISDEQQMNLVFRFLGNANIQSRIKRRAKRLMKKRIYTVLGLPGPGGSIIKQRQWQRIYQKSGLESI